ncbi:hypothetical protein CXF68_19745 [Tenacibaculum sp. Bg11-29]|uniref:hypothetical protein n=1 Tax=Tenacibaculum sp. Bg11-29 TaxID=2058306 RepID=UPI000C33E724|nr:hypothetical protein [Tenacibaculum sp. Bg11-29]PKH52791.1 hypothetical protein CXF68_19745 [Tenacibaculum sp. Bg11-29]
MIIKHLENKKVVWFKDTNEYIVIEPMVAEILSLLHNKTDKKEIITKVFNQISIPLKEAENLVRDIENLLNNQHSIKQELVHVSKPDHFEHKKYYKINDIIFKVNYLSEFEYALVHPKFAHIAITTTKKITHHFEVYSNTEFISFTINNNIIGTWNLSDVHYFQGKFSMKITELIHHKPENEWLGVFHASAVSNETESILFLGDSGNGKSTSLALLQANGFTCLADDFVPVDAKKQEVYSFPSAISIKKNSLPTLLPIYPELENSAEYHFKRLNKIVRYLPTNNVNHKSKQPCKALIFIKYKKDSDIIIDKISNIKAFEQLVPDSWLSPIQENVETFLNWFSNLPCYQLTYSNNSEMVATVSKIFNDEL